jgi:hypothetical protein
MIAFIEIILLCLCLVSCDPADVEQYEIVSGQNFCKDRQGVMSYTPSFRNALVTCKNGDKYRTQKSITVPNK